MWICMWALYCSLEGTSLIRLINKLLYIQIGCAIYENVLICLCLGYDSQVSMYLCLVDTNYKKTL